MEVSGYIEVRKTILPGAVRCDVYMASDVGEPMVIRRVHASPAFEIASAQGMTAAKMKALDPAFVQWGKSVELNVRLSNAHIASDPVVRLFLRETALTRTPAWLLDALLVAGIGVDGGLPFRRSGRFTIWSLVPFEGLRVSVRRTLAASNTIRRAKASPTES